RQAVAARRQELALPEWRPEPEPPRQSRPPWKPWEAWEDALIATLSLAEAAQSTGRTWLAVAQRRHRLGLTRPPAVAVQKARMALEAKVAAVRQAATAVALGHPSESLTARNERAKASGQSTESQH